MSLLFRSPNKAMNGLVYRRIFDRPYRLEYDSYSTSRKDIQIDIRGPTPLNYPSSSIYDLTTLKAALYRSKPA